MDLPDAPLSNLPDAATAQQSDPASTGSIQGTVSNKEGAVYEGVRISLTRPAAAGQTARPPQTTVSDANGRFSFSNLAPGEFLLTISSDGFATQKISGSLKAGDTFQAPPIVLALSTATSEVRVSASREEIAEADLHLEEQQRIFGILPNFYIVYDPNAPSLSTRQKYSLAFKTAFDPATLAADGIIAGIQQANNSFSGYGQGAAGYGKRFGANLADSTVGIFLGGAVFPAILKQDPRYFYKGTGSKRSRALYAIANAVICKGDNGRWQPNYSAILGGLAAGGVSNLYYPAKNRQGVTLTFENALYSLSGSAIGNLFEEFLSHKLTPKVPDYSHPTPVPTSTETKP